MKKIAVIGNSINLAESIKGDLSAYFPKYEINTYTTKVVIEKGSIEEDAIVLSSWLIFNKIKEKITPKHILEVVSLTLNQENLKRMEAVRGIKRAFLVNYDYRVCMQVITQLYEAGFEEIDFIPYYGDVNVYDPSVEVAVTPNEAQLAPPGVKVIDIGERTVEPNCILRLANKMGAGAIFDTEEAEVARKNVVLRQWGLDNLLSENYNVKNNIKAVIEYIEDGILICDNHGKSYLCNEKAKTLLKIDAVDGLNMNELLPDVNLGKSNMKDETAVVNIEGKNLVFTSKAIFSKEGKNGNLIVIKNFDEVEERQHRIRNKVLGADYLVRYSFDDIKGESTAIKEVIALAKRVAKSNSSVMILGESGTGKEVFAQSIHHASERGRYNFVALNCAAIPENLLESELFGYEEGAFTGAKKGGKIGYFELAHKGTIFLDEIGEMPLVLQGKLLRVIEERKVSRIGASKLVDIDVRIIAATNQDLTALVAKKQFREDLYYRLNVLPIRLPNVNERGRDILMLFDAFKESLGGRWKYTQEVEEKLLNHKWKGNVREIRNIVEYLDHLGKDIIEASDLPKELFEEKRTLALQPCPQAESGPAGDNLLFKSFLLKEGSDIQLHLHVLEALLQAKEENLRTGREQIKHILENRGLDYTETEIRNSLHKLTGYGYVRALKGRGGSRILLDGEYVLEKIKGFVGV